MSANPQSLAYRAVWERAQSLAMCQAVVITVALGDDEFAGFCAGYIGEGEFITEPFHVRFRAEEAVHLIIGERSPLTRKEVLFEQWSPAARAGVMAARQKYRSLVANDDEGFLIASPAELSRIKWTGVDEGSSDHGRVDARVWLRITAQLGLNSTTQEEE